MEDRWRQVQDGGYLAKVDEVAFIVSVRVEQEAACSSIVQSSFDSSQILVQSILRNVLDKLLADGTVVILFSENSLNFFYDYDFVSVVYISFNAISNQCSTMQIIGSIILELLAQLQSYQMLIVCNLLNRPQLIIPMIKILNLTHKSSFLLFAHKFYFSTPSEPYYILGVEKGADFKDIKKAFYKLANEYHPDKNDSADAKKKFLLIKQAFEQIKIEKGLMKAQNFVDSVQSQSVRPNADQFTPDQEEGYKSTRDYRIFRQKAGMDSKYSQFNSSFQTIHDINDVKIKVEEGEMKDASERFNLNSMKAKIVTRSENSKTVVIIGMVGIFLILAFMNELYEGTKRNIQQEKVISSSQSAKNQKIVGEKEKKQKMRDESEKKLRHQQLMKIIHPEEQQSKNDKSSVKKKSGIEERLAWSRLVEDSKQDFISSNQRVI